MEWTLGNVGGILDLGALGNGSPSYWERNGKPPETAGNHQETIQKHRRSAQIDGTVAEDHQIFDNHLKSLVHNRRQWVSFTEMKLIVPGNRKIRSEMI